MAILRLPDPVQKLMMTEESVLRQIRERHDPDGRVIDSKALIRIIEEILYRAIPLDFQAAMQEKPIPADVNNAMLEALSYIVSRISAEMTHKCLPNADAHATALSLLQVLSNYTWDAKLVLLLAAFVLNYGEFWLLIQIHSSSKLAKKITILKQVPNLETLKERLGVVNNLIMSMLDLAKCIIEFMERRPESIDLPEVSTAFSVIATSIYWATRGIVICAAHTKLTAMNYEDPTLSLRTLEKNLFELAEKIKSSNERLQKQLALCYRIIEEKKENDAYELLVKTFSMDHDDNMEVLTGLLTDGDAPPLIQGSTNREVHLEVLKRKHVLFLISGLMDATSYDLQVLSVIYTDIKARSGPTNDFEFVWIPMVESSTIWTEAMQKKFEKCLQDVPWYSVRQPSLISKPVKRFIREKFDYRNWPILVVLDPQGKVANFNAFHMMYVWGSFAFPFTKQREQELWAEENWHLELIVGAIDVDILHWMRSGKYIILYGGDDMEWIRDFTTTARRVAQASGIQLEMVYVGNPGQSALELKPLVQSINTNRVSSCWMEIMILFFWTRLGSMLLSKIEVGTNDEDDEVMQGTEKLLMYGRMGSWALFSRGTFVSLIGHGPTLLQILHKFDEWKEKVEHGEFLNALKEQYNQIHGDDHPCCHLEFPDAVRTIPENTICPECRRPMEQFADYSCCHGQ